MVSAAVETALAKNKTPESGLDSFLKGFSVANDLSLKAMEQAKAMLGLPTMTEEKREIGWPEVIMQMGPTILGTLQQAMASPRPQPQQVQTQQVQPSQPPHTPEALPMNTPSKPLLPPPPPETIPLLKIMQNYAPMLMAHLADQSNTPEALAQQLCGLLGPDLDSSIIATANHVSQHGPMILAHAHPDLATDRAAQVLTAWAEMIQATQEPPE
jgi:hypothetical protein